MAYVVWRVLMKKYSKVRLGLQKGTSCPHSTSNIISPIWASTSQFYSIEDIDHNAKIAITQSSDGIETESTNTNFSKMRSYLKRCENAINSMNLGGKRSTSSASVSGTTDADIRPKQSTSSWYIDELESEINESHHEFTYIDSDSKVSDIIEPIIYSIPDTQSSKVNNESANDCIQHIEHLPILLHADEKCFSDLVDTYLAALYPKYFESTRAVLLRQARDLLETVFYADLSRFESEFLSPAAELIKIIKNASHNLARTACVDGWPLAIHGKVILQLGTLNESILTSSDIYLCIKPASNYNVDKSSGVNLCAVWRSFKTQTVVYRTLDPIKYPLTAISLEMLTEDLPQLLQSLLVSVEQTISRVPFDELAFPKYMDEDEIDNLKSTNDNAFSNGQKTESRMISGSGSPKCAIKRREIITKNKPIQNRYTLRRMSIKTESDNRDKRQSDATAALPSSTQTTHVNSTTNSTTSSNNMMPLFCLGGSFPHIDSDEDSGDDGTKSPNEQACHHHDIVAPRSITDLPEKLLTSGLYLSDTHDINGFPIITIETKILMESGLNCYEVATLILYYNTIPTIPSKFTLHVIVSDSNQLPVLNLLDTAFNLLTGHVHIDCVLVSTLFTTDKLQFQLPSSKIKIIHAIQLFDYIPPECAPKMCNGSHVHNQSLWREFFVTLELLRNQCVSVGQDLVSVMNEIRLTDSLGMPSRRQLYSQHRALSRALMDSELQCLRRKGQITLTRLQSLAKSISNNDKISTNHHSTSTDTDYSNRHVFHRLKEVTAIFGEVDRAARRLEQLTEQRRERLREITRQKALEEEMKEITKWIQNDGESMLKKYADVPLDSETSIKDCEHDFEKFYFISMKYLAKGHDLDEAALNLESARELRTNLKLNLNQYSERLETIRERVEGAVRLHHLLSLDFKEKDVQMEMHKLAEKIGALGLIERYRNVAKSHSTIKIDRISTPLKEADNCSCWPSDTRFHSNKNDTNNSVKSAEIMADEDEDHSKMADSGLGGCDRCEMNDKLIRTCSCQSFDEPTTKSHNSDEMEEDCFDNNMKSVIDYQMSPLKPNAHLYSYSSNIALPDFENSCGLAPKTQKTLLLIMREMIGTERDYVRSLHYIIDNYMDEMNREDIPQALRGQRNVIFGNVEKICEFHQQYFLHELERCENNPLKVGAVFLEHESKFYLYALYNKNKPKSDALMSEYGSRFFKAKQMELGDKMDLASYLLKPVQRMGKYALLLQQLMKAVTSIQGPSLQEIAEDIEELQRAEEMVRFQLRHGNDLLAMDSLRDCDVNVKEQGRLLRQNEFLVWQGKTGKKSIRQVFLFEDLVLFSKARRFPDSKNLDIYLYKNSIKTSDIGLTEFVGDSTTKFEIWFRKMKPDDTWTLQSMNEDTKKAWTEEISKLLWKQAKRNREIRMAEMSSMGIGNKPCLDIRPSQNQINDRSVSFSQLEKAPKLRSSFSSTISDNTKVVQRPNSIISLGSSFSSSTSRSSGSTSSSGSHSNPNTRNTAVLSVELDMINETLPLKTDNKSKKYQRSTTLASQLSMESGIIADISSSPDNEVQTSDETSGWTRSSSSFLPHKSQSDNSNQMRTTLNSNATQKLANENDVLGANSTTNPYINNDSIAVHL